MDLEKQVTALISKSLKISEDKIKPDSSFVDDLGADSLDIVELVMAMEDEFQIDIPDKDAEAIKTVQDAISYIGKHKAA
jgi:acyl carrier protein